MRCAVRGARCEGLTAGISLGVQLLVIRHAIAEEREDFARSGRDDSERPLTDEGREKMRRNAEALRRLVPSLDLLASSPYVRARQTAELVAEAYERATDRIAVVESLTPEAPLERFQSWVQRQSKARVIAVVGHEPQLGMLVTWLMSGLRESRVELKKGGACLLEFQGQPGPGVGTMRWLLTAGQLRGLRS
jgi:phosphohistidine phosphatase